MSQPLVSIIIPSYNYGPFISQTLDCLLAQSYQNWEAVIIDDGSTDETQQVVEGYVAKYARFIYIHQPNQGPSVARNTGMKRARGAYLHFLDADDLLSKDKITEQVSYMEQHPDCDISYTRAYYFEDQKPNELFTNRNLTKKKKDRMPKIHARGQDVLPYLIKANIMQINAALIRRGGILKNNFFFDESYQSAEDWEFWLRCAYKNALFSYFDNKLAYVLIRIHPNSLSQNRVQMHEHDIKVRYAIKAYLEQFSRLKHLRKINNMYLHSPMYKAILWKDSRVSYAGVLHIMKKIGWVDTIRLIFRELKNDKK